MKVRRPIATNGRLSCSYRKLSFVSVDLIRIKHSALVTLLELEPEASNSSTFWEIWNSSQQRKLVCNISQNVKLLL